jgi:glycosyltransferase involved in cell wall biosynthesis
LKIAYLTVSMPFGPGETFFIPEAQELKSMGHSLLIIPRSPSGTVVNKDARGLETASLREPLLSIRILSGAFMELITHPILTICALIQVIRFGRIGVLLSNLSVFPKALWIAQVVRQRQIEHIHSQWALTTATVAMVASRVSGVPWSFTAHRGDIEPNNLLALKVRQASFVRFISHDGIRMASSLGASCADSKGVVIRMGVDIPPIDTLKEPLPHARPIAICPANLLPVKGHRYLFEAISILKDAGIDVDLEVAGSGALDPELREYAASLGLNDRIRFIGQVPHEELLNRYAKGDVSIVVLSSVKLGEYIHEGVPVCLIEAMAYGVPVVSTNTGAIPELLSSGGGLLVPDKDAPALADAIRTIVCDEETRRHLVKQGRQVVEAEYDVRLTTGSLVEQMANAG